MGRSQALRYPWLEHPIEVTLSLRGRQGLLSAFPPQGGENRTSRSSDCEPDFPSNFLAPGREALKLALFQQDRDLFTQTLDLLFLDTTSVFVWRETETPLRRHGYSRDRRPDQPQVVLCVVVGRQGCRSLGTSSRATPPAGPASAP